MNSPPFIPINQRCQWQSELMKVNRWKSESIVKVPLDRSVEILDRRPSLRFVEQVSHRDLGVCGVAGVQALFLAASWAYRALKIGGAAYLVYSGGRMILRSRRRSNFIGNPSEGTRQISRRRAYVIGIATGLANPRYALSVASIFPVALPAKPTLSIAGAAVATMVAVSLGWYFLVIYRFTTGSMVRGFARSVTGSTGSPVACSSC